MTKTVIASEAKQSRAEDCGPGFASSASPPRNDGGRPDDKPQPRCFTSAMRTDLFDFDLPPERIALRPIAPRDAARMLVVRPGADPELEDRGVHDLPDILQPGDALVVNDTKVIPARLSGRRIGR